MYSMDWQITIGGYRLGLLTSTEIHRSVDVLADTCTIVLPGYAYNKPIQDKDEKISADQMLNRGDAVEVCLGYNGNLVKEFTGYLLRTSTDDDTLTLECEDELFLLRKDVKDKEFRNVKVKQIAEYLVQQTGVHLVIKCTLPTSYDKFVIQGNTAYDILKKLEDETKANIYVRNGELHIHPLYEEKLGEVAYSFQQNIEQSSLKYKRAEDKKLEVVVEKVGADGKKKEVRSGTKGGDKTTIKGSGQSDDSLSDLADAHHKSLVYDGYDGDITTWLVPYVEPGYTARITDEDYKYKDGRYYVKAVTTSFSESGASRKVQLGIKLAANGQV